MKEKNKIFDMVGGIGLLFFGIGMFFYLSLMGIAFVVTKSTHGAWTLFVFPFIYCSIVYVYVKYLLKKYKNKRKA